MLGMLLYRCWIYGMEGLLWVVDTCCEQSIAVGGWLLWMTVGRWRRGDGPDSDGG